MTENEHLDQLCALAHAAAIKAMQAHGDFPDDTPYAQQNQITRDSYRAMVCAVLDGSAQHIAAMLQGIGNELHRANHRAQVLSSQLHDTREWAIDESNTVKLLAPLLREAANVIGKRGVLKLDLLSRIDAALEDLPTGINS